VARRHDTDPGTAPDPEPDLDWGWDEEDPGADFRGDEDRG
jgi:hypothetical protein